MKQLCKLICFEQVSSQLPWPLPGLQIVGCRIASMISEYKPILIVAGIVLHRDVGSGSSPSRRPSSTSSFCLEIPFISISNNDVDNNWWCPHLFQVLAERTSTASGTRYVISMIKVHPDRWYSSVLLHSTMDTRDLESWDLIKRAENLYSSPHV